MPANEGVNNLHSDLEHGLHKRVWDVELDEVHNAVRMTTSLEDGELGLPGNRTFTAVFTVTRTRLLPYRIRLRERPRHLRGHDQPHVL